MHGIYYSVRIERERDSNCEHYGGDDGCTEAAGVSGRGCNRIGRDSRAHGVLRYSGTAA